MNNYHVYGQIGKGKHSAVYKGRKKKTIQYYAIKSVDKSQKPRVLQEVRTMHSLEHENVLKFYAWYETANHLWLILEYCVGGDLMTLLKQDVRLPEESIHDFARDLGRALQSLHANSVVYCDLKPSNILLDENGRLKLCDFGLARRLSDIAKNSVQQLPQAKRGTPAYMAPELLEEGGVHSFGSDLWGLGCVMYECYAGRPPFTSSSFTQLVNSILSDPPPPLPGNPSQEFQDLVFRLLQKDPLQRISWDELRNHPFWRVQFKTLTLPPQPALENYLRMRPPSLIRAPPPPLKEGMAGLGGEGQPGTRVTLGDVRTVDRNAGGGEEGLAGVGGSGKARPLREISQNTGVHVLRLSRIVRSNLQRETEGDAYRQGTQGSRSTDDITLENHDLELDFAERPEDDTADEEEEEEEEEQQGAAGGGTAGERAGGPTPLREESSSSRSQHSQRSHHSRSTSSSDVEGASSGAMGGGGWTGGAAGLGGATGTPGRERGAGEGRAPEGGAAAPPLREPEGTPGSEHGRTPAGGAMQAVTAKLGALHLEPAATPPNLGAGRKGHRTGVTAGADPHLTQQPSKRQERELGGGGGGGAGERGEQEEESGGAGGRETRGAHWSLARLLWHASDLAVKPIMLNRRIEKVTDPAYDPRQLAVPALTPESLTGGGRDHAESFIASIVALLTQASTSQTEKVNTLRYLETLCSNTEAANLLINSGLVPFLVKILRTQRPTLTLRVQILSVIGLLIRHATLVHEELAGAGLVGVLSECLRDRQEKVRRRAMASLGELLFYIATQSKAPGGEPGGGQHSGWQVPATTISLVGSLLRRGEDEIAQHYAVKTIENVASEGGEWAARFASSETFANLCHIYRHATAKQEHLKVTAGNCLVRLARFVPGWIATVVERLGVRELVGGLARGTSREQQIHLSLLNAALSSGGSSTGTGGGGGGGGGGAGGGAAKVVQQIVEDKALAPAVAALLEHASEVVRGKAALCAALLCRAHRRALLALCAHKMVPAVERLSKDRDEYVRGAVAALVQTLGSAVPPIMSQIAADLEHVVGGGGGGGGSNGSLGRKAGSAMEARLGPGSGLHGGGVGGLGVASYSPASGARGVQHLRSSLALFPVLLHLITSATFRGTVVNDTLLRQLAGFLGRMEGASFQGQEEFQSTLMHTLEALSQHGGILLRHRAIVQSALLPSFAALHRKAPSGDMRFLCLKILCDIVGVFLEDQSEAGAAAAEAATSAAGLADVDEGEKAGAGRGRGKGESLAELNEQLEEFAKCCVLPLYPAILDDEDPMPMYAQKLLVTLLDHGVVQVADIDRLDLISRLFTLLCGELAAITVHTVRLCLQLALNPALETRHLSELQVVAKLGALLEDVYEERMEDFLEPVLSLCLLFLQRDAKGDGGEEGANPGQARTGTEQPGRTQGRDRGGRRGEGSGRLGRGKDRGGGGEGGHFIQDMADLSQQSDLFLELVGSDEPIIAETAGECLFLLMAAAPEDSAPGLLRNQALFADLLEKPARSHGPELVARLRWQLLQALGRAFRVQRHGRGELDPEALVQDFGGVLEVVGALREGEDDAVVQAAEEVAMEFEHL